MKPRAPQIRLHPARPLPWAIHGAFWLLVLSFYTFYFGRETGDYRQSFIFVCLLLPVTLATTYFLTRFLIPRYLLTNKYGRFVLYSVYTLIGSVYLELVVVVASFVLAGYRIAAMNPATLDILNLIIGQYLVVFVAVAADLWRRWYAMQTAHARQEQARLEAELKLKEAELKLLRAQIHPHFLFNTLNNLYGLTLERSDLAPDVVLRISELLDYMLYRCEAPRVSLQGEVQHIGNYLALEKLRYDDRVQVSFDTEGPVAQATIAPMLLIPFVENAFKHGVSQDQRAGWVRIHLRSEGHALMFTVENSKPPQASIDADRYTEGIGLENVCRRLDLLYPDRHTLTIDDDTDRFTITLHLHLDSVPCVSSASS